MKFPHIASAAIFAGALMMTGANASDLYVPEYTPDPNIDLAEARSIWDGFYAGVGLSGSRFMTGANPSNKISVDGIVGANMTVDSYLLGAEMQMSGVYDATFGQTWNIKGELRAGYLISPEILIYGAFAGKYWEQGALYGGLGAGVEFAVSDNVSFDVEAVYYPWSNNTYTDAELSASVLWHF